MNVTDVKEGDRVQLKLIPARESLDANTGRHDYRPEFVELTGIVKAVTPTIIWIQADEVDSRPSVLFFGAHYWESGRVTGPAGIEEYELDRA